jgi:hypothetical protein
MYLLLLFSHATSVARLDSIAVMENAVLQHLFKHSAYRQFGNYC